VESQMHVVASEVEMMWVPSDENTTELSESLCPRRGGNNMVLDRESHTRTVVSHDPETIRLPSGENATEVTHASCPSRAAT
jgi:hypothetical protein